MNLVLRFRSLVAVGIVMALAVVPARADLKKVWTQKELMQKSNLVVIAKPLKSVPTKKCLNLLRDRGIDVDLVTVDSTFQPTLVLKGSLDKSETVILSHYKVKSINELVVENLPRFAEFRTTDITVDVGQNRKVIAPPAYLLFLVKGDDGKYEFTSGQYDAGASILEVNDSWSDTESLKR